MLLGRAAQAWNALYDNLYLTHQLEGEIRTQLGQQSALLPKGLCNATRSLVGATAAELSDYFRDRRDYIESVATLDLVVAVERSIREDLGQRRIGLKSQVSPLGAALLAIPNAPGQLHPAARKLLDCWRGAVNANVGFLDSVDEAMQYRNWLVHGGIGIPPYLLNPFLLDQPVEHVVSLVNSEP